MKKEDYANTIATLLALDPKMEKDLMKLKEDTLVKIYKNYIQNAKDANHKLERVHDDAFKQKSAASRYQDIHKA